MYSCSLERVRKWRSSYKLEHDHELGLPPNCKAANAGVGAPTWLEKPRVVYSVHGGKWGALTSLSARVRSLHKVAVNQPPPMTATLGEEK